MTKEQITKAIVKLGENKMFEFKRLKNNRATYTADNEKVVCSVNVQNDEYERFERLKELSKGDDFTINY